MTITYNLDVPHFGLKGFLSILFRWHGGVWKAVALPLFYWLIAYYTVTCCYYYLFRPYDKYIFDKVMDALRGNLDTFIPMTFILGFFVSSVLARWQDWLKNMGWIEGVAGAVAAYIQGTDEKTRAMRRNVIRYLVLSQTLILRNISVQVRRRFPTLETIEAADLMSSEERKILENTTDDIYTQYWIPIIWAEKIVSDARENKKIRSEPFAVHIERKIDGFRTQLRNLLIYDWAPIPLVYSQLVTLCVRLYFFMCLFTRQIIKSDDIGIKESPLFWIPFATIIEFIIYMGWLKVAEDMLHPLGDEFGNFECNYIIDKNLITGLTLVDKPELSYPELKKDAFWDKKKIIPLHTFETAQESISTMNGTASNVNFVKNCDNILMVPHKSKLVNMSKDEQEKSIQKVDVKEYNKSYRKKDAKYASVDGKRMLENLKTGFRDHELKQILIKKQLFDEK